MKDKIKTFFKNEKLISYVIIILMAIATCIPLFSKHMNILQDDGIQHIYRLTGTYSSLQEKNMFPNIMSGFCNGFGYSWNIFYSPLTAYLPLIFKIFIPSFVVLLKIFMFLTILLSGIFMYKLVYKISNSNIASVLSACIYIIAPYHLTDLYSRIAIAELASFMFLPLVFLGLYNLLNDNKKTYYLSIGAIGLMLSHNVITLYTAIFCLIYLIINYKKINFKLVRKLLIHVLVIVLCTSFYWLPLLEHYFSTTYEVFVQGRMYSNSVINQSKLELLDLLVNKPWGMNFHIGIPVILGIIFFAVYLKKIDKRYKKDVIIFLIFGIFSIIMSLRIFPFEYLPDFLKMIQFTWRMHEFASFFLSIVAGITISIFIKENNNRLFLVSIFIIINWLVLMLSLNCYTNETFKEEQFLQPVPVDSSTGRVHAGCATFEYLPKKAFSNLDYLKQRSKHAIILDGIASIQYEEKEGTKMSFKVNNIDATSSLKIELPYIYYLGYNAKVTDENGNVSNLEIRESDKGFCMIEIFNMKSCEVKIDYTGTNLMKISYLTTILGIFMLLFYFIKFAI